MLDRIITYSFYALFFLTPLFWTSQNYELFEFNKMLLVYGFTVVIVGTWLLKIINHKSLNFNRTPLDIPLLLFLGANILSTIFSIDPHTSIWGYYSRSNGGLLSLVSYLLLYWAFVSNMDKNKVLTTLKYGLISGFIISLWAIFEHLGVSPSCVILRGEFNASCWIQDVQARVFASLGQPGWLAAYLAMLLFPALYFFLTATTRRLQAAYWLLLASLYMAFTFTYSRGPMLGLIAGFVAFTYLYISITLKATDSINLKPFLLVIFSFILINLLFGSALSSFRLVSLFAAPVRPTISLQPVSSMTQLENGGTESGQIRLIVWKGAWEIFKHYPILGSGLETFAYSYYQYRPAAHNMTSEWDFLYNKAHNEYLNYLATTGIVGFATYMLVISTFIFLCIKYYVSNIKQKKHNTYYLILTTSLLSAYISYLVYNFFLFSVVIIAVFFYVFPAIFFVATESVKTYSLQLTVYKWIYKKPIYTKIAKGIIIFAAIYLLFSVFKLWYADTLFAKGQRASDSGRPGIAYNLLSQAAQINSGEPYYRSELAYAAAAAATALKESDATLSAALKDEALTQLDITLKSSPKNVSFWRTAVRTYFELSSLDKKYVNKTLETLDQTISLAPTDPKLYYNKALILNSLDKKDEEIQALQKALQLKPNYQEVIDQIKQAAASAKP